VKRALGRTQHAVTQTNPSSLRGRDGGAITPSSHLHRDNKKADVAEHLAVFDHVGLPVDKPPGMARVLFA